MAAAAALPLALGAEDRAGGLAAGGVCVLLLALAALTARHWLITASLAGFLALYALSDTGFPAPLAGGLLLLAAELVAASIDERIPVRAEAGVRAARLRTIGWVAALGTAAGALVLAVEGLGASRSTPLTLAGAAAVVACLALLARQAPRRST